jgi:hypothetical protein
MAIELVPCPFCGGRVMFRKALFVSDGCTDAIIHAEPTKCGMTDFTTYTTDESVITAWNTRAELRALAGAEVGGWISVEDRLPIDLATFDGIFHEIAVIATDGHFVEQSSFQVGNGAGKPWAAWSNYNPFKSTQITHWQPLPPPPGSGRGGD